MGEKVSKEFLYVFLSYPPAYFTKTKQNTLGNTHYPQGSKSLLKLNDINPVV